MPTIKGCGKVPFKEIKVKKKVSSNLLKLVKNNNILEN